MEISREQDILLEEVRLKIIEDIKSPANNKRKKEALKRYECYKDNTVKYVEELLLKMFSPETVDEMRYSLANLSFVKKIINKLARVYSNGVQRKLKNKSETQKLDGLSKKIKFDTKMKKANRYLKLFKNTMILVKPKKVYVDGQELFDLKISVLPPFLYDVVPDPNDKERALVVITSSFSANNLMYSSLNPQLEGRGYTTPGIESSNASSIEDAQEYVWWSDSYHFTTNGKGVIISGSEIENPIGVLPTVTLAEDQDDHFWAMGGSDLVDGAILVNSMISNTNHIGIVQGYGQAVVIGKDIPERIKMGPNFAIKLKQNDGEPAPSFEFKSANPPLTELREQTVMYIALLLSANNMSTSGVKVSLDSGADFASGVALMIDKSESVEDVTDQAKAFHDMEREVWILIDKWMQIYRERSLLVDDLKEFTFSEKTFDRMELKFVESKPIITEKEKLESIKLRQELGINTMIELLKIDNPELTDEQAEQKLLEITAEKLENMAEFGIDSNTEATNEEDPELDKETGQEKTPSKPVKGNTPKA